MYLPDRYYEYPSGMIVCGECVNADITATKKGDLVGEERVTPDMVRWVRDDKEEAYQCDGCGKQNEAYDELGEEL